MNTHAQKAAHTLKHYFRLIAEKSGVKWNSDNDAEIEQIIEEILDAAGDYTDEAIDSHNDAQVSHKV